MASVSSNKKFFAATRDWSLYHCFISLMSVFADSVILIVQGINQPFLFHLLYHSNCRTFLHPSLFYFCALPKFPYAIPEYLHPLATIDLWQIVFVRRLFPEWLR